MSKSTMKIIGWVVSIVVAIIGTFGATTAITNKNNNNNSNKNDNKQTQNQTQEQKQEQNISITINGEQVEINKDNAQTVYGELEDEKDKLSEELDAYKENYAKEALVSVNPNYNAEKVSLFAFEPVEKEYWDTTDGTLKDSLGNEYTVDLPHIIMNGKSYAKYYPNGKFSKLKFTLATHETTHNGCTESVTISLDNNTVVKIIDGIDRSFIPKTYTIDLKGSQFVEIKCTSNSWHDYSQVMLLDAQFIK